MRRRGEFVLDASAILAWAQLERGYQEVKRILRDTEKGRAKCAVSWINLGEVYYLALRRLGRDMAEEFLVNFKRLRVDLVLPSEGLVLEAAELKAVQERLSFADCFAAALSISRKATLVATDPDFATLGDRLAFLRL